MRQPVDHPAAWSPSPTTTKDTFTLDLAPRHVDALGAALAHARRAGRSVDDLGIDDFPLDDIAADLDAWRRQVRDGRGLLILRGFPLDDHDIDDVGLMYFGLGLHFGMPVSQSNMGDRLGHVIDVGGQDARERAYRSARELKLHTDRCDHVGMLCVQPAWRGGVSGYASAVTIHNRMLAERPELLEPLYHGFHMHQFGQQPPGEPPVSRLRVPVFSQADGVFNVIYLRRYIDLAEIEGHVTLSAVEREALAYFEQVANRDDVRLDFTLERGEVTLFNNCLLLHTRTAFEDAPHEQPRRHIMRLWLMEAGRPAVPGVAAHKTMSGIAPQQGRGTYYAA